jgi:mannitol/fructose-specific phosphotransferase system IIA component (Ntr-type)
LSKAKKSKGAVGKKSEDKLYEDLVLAAIQTESHRPGAITRIVKILNQNQVVKILNKLEKEDRVERVSTKSWQAT